MIFAYDREKVILINMGRKINSFKVMNDFRKSVKELEHTRESLEEYVIL